MKVGRGIVCGVALVLASGIARAQERAAAGPAELRVDNLVQPLGIDDATPLFSWQLHDAAPGARQGAYEVRVASRPELLRGGKADVWDSGRVESGQSLNVKYAGPALKASTRYFWTVTVWGAAGNAYPEAASSWETGLMTQDAWQAQWIGYETPEEAAVRHAPAQWIAGPDALAGVSSNTLPMRIAYRTSAQVTKPVKRAVLYATGQDTVAAWVNGQQVLEAQPFPAWHQMPWKKFVRADVTKAMREGANAIAVQTVTYTRPSQVPPMIATLFVEYADGSVQTFASDIQWKANAHAAEGWQQAAFDDAAWMDAVEWKAAPGPMNAPPGHPWIPDSVKALRNEFDVKKPVKSARLYATALGAYEMFLNGKRVSEDVLAPGWTDYRERVAYQAYDVTHLLAQGNNAVGALLAPGWYSTPLEWFQQPNNYGDTPPALRAQLRLEYADGSVEWVNTDATWKASTSYIQSAELYDGEAQDGRKIFPTIGGFVTSVVATDWPRAEEIDQKPTHIAAQEFQPIRIEREMAALKMTQPKPGVYVFDFGQNLAGVERLRVSGPRGTEVRVRFAEILNDDGTLYTENLRTAKATDHFILAGKGVEEFQPQFTFHGFRYAEITGLPAAPAKGAITALVMHTNAPFDTELKTGSTMANKLWSNILWGQRSNFVGVPTDCPQRDERLGWMADAQVFWRTASYNMDLAAFSRQFARDMRGTQAGTPFYGIYAPGTATKNSGYGAGWSDAGVIIPWTSWLQSGDTSIIDENWDAMTKYLAAIEQSNPDALWKNSGIPFGDWLAPEGKTDQVLIATAYWAYDATLMREMAHATGRTGAETKYEELFAKIRAAFQKQFVHADGFVAGADTSPSQFGERTKPSTGTGDTQTGYVLALHMNLLPANLRAAAAQKLVEKIAANHGLLATGFLGTPYLLEELTKAGHADVAYSLLLNTRYPSWGYLVEHGATTMWERWNGDQMKSDPSMNSYNHYAYGAVADWMYRYAAGVDASPLDAGFHTVVLHPVFDARLAPVEFSYRSAYGTIRSSWSVQGNTATWHVTIPANTTGFLDVSGAEAAKYVLEGAALTWSKIAKPMTMDGRSGFALEPGTYTFVVSF
jgi:alpha-L-rhamnosidase